MRLADAATRAIDDHIVLGEVVRLDPRNAISFAVANFWTIQSGIQPMHIFCYATTAS